MKYLGLKHAHVSAARTLAASVALAFLLTCHQARAQGAAGTIKVATFPIDVTAAAYYAHEQGFFKAHGLDVQVITGANGGAVAAAVAGGSLQFGDANTGVLASAYSHGLPFVLVAPNGLYTAQRLTAAMVVSKTSAIRNASDLAGKTIGMLVIKGIQEVAARAWLEKHHIEDKSVHFLEVPLSEMGAALTSGRIDAVVVEEPQLGQILKRDGGRVIGRPYAAIGPRWEQGAYFCTRVYALAHPDVVKKFSDAIAEADAWANAHPDLSAKVLAKYSKAPLLTTQARILYPERLHAADFQSFVDAAAKYGLISASFPASEMFAPGIGP